MKNAYWEITGDLYHKITGLMQKDDELMRLSREMSIRLGGNGEFLTIRQYTLMYTAGIMTDDPEKFIVDMEPVVGLVDCYRPSVTDANYRSGILTEFASLRSDSLGHILIAMGLHTFNTNAAFEIIPSIELAGDSCFVMTDHNDMVQGARQITRKRFNNRHQ